MVPECQIAPERGDSAALFAKVCYLSVTQILLLARTRMAHDASKPTS